MTHRPNAGKASSRGSMHTAVERRETRGPQAAASHPGTRPDSASRREPMPVVVNELTNSLPSFYE